jgi:tRNA A37 threonylcarbamoyladenosine biosynthesis protein TsaE
MDLYRLDKAKSKGFTALNLEDVFRESVSLVEWSSRIPDFMIPSDRIEFKFSFRESADESNPIDPTRVDDVAEREAVITPYGLFWECAMQEIVERGYLEDIVI